MDDREELLKLRRLRELEAKMYGGDPSPRLTAGGVGKAQVADAAKPMGGAMDFAKGAKHGFDKAAYAASEFFPDLPISQASRDKWNNNLLVKALGVAMPSRQDMAQELAQGKQIADGSYAGAAGDFVGSAAPAMAAGMATGGASLIPAATVQAGLGYMTTPGGVGDRLKGAAFAAGGEGLGRMLPQSFARLAQPIRPTAAAQRLIDQGVYPTPGRAAGGGWKTLEDAMTSHWAPGVGSAISAGQNNAVSDAAALAMSRGGINVPAGREGYRMLDNYFTNEFDDVTSRLMFNPNDAQYMQGIEDIIRNNGLDKNGINEVRNFMNTYRNNMNMPLPGKNNLQIGNVMPPKRLSGQDTHALLEKLRKEGASFRKSSDPYHKRIGQAYSDIYDLTDNSIASQGMSAPEDIARFKELRREYAEVVPAIRAGEQTTVNRSQGVFTPEQYQSEMVKNAKSMGNTKGVRTGTLRQQQLADDMVEVLGGKYPDSGTAKRLAVSGAIPALAGGFIDPVAGAASLAGIAGMYGLTRAAYSKAGRKYMMGGMSPVQGYISDVLRSGSPAFGTLGAATLPQFNQEQ